jgi:hypothetical protein
MNRLHTDFNTIRETENIKYIACIMRELLYKYAFRATPKGC